MMHIMKKTTKLRQPSGMVAAKDIKQKANMTQDCLNSPSTADVSYRLPKGIHVTGADDESDPAIEGMPWGQHFKIDKKTILDLLYSKTYR